jgi:CubicO group peptidase (beta-lactamase class C family)
MPGVAVAITHGTRAVHAKGYGHDSTGAPMTGRTPMRLASVSKSFTALAVMQLVEDGGIDLDRPVRTYLPESRMADERAARITVRQVLSNSSGLSQSVFPIADLPVARGAREAVAQLTGARLGADPGARWEYHNANYWVAARLVEVVSGESFGDYLSRRIFVPLGMEGTTSTSTTRDPVPGLAEGYTQVYGVPVARPEISEFSVGSGGVISTAEDMTAWLISQSNGGRGPDGTRILSAAGVAELHRPSAPGGEYGLGWFDEKLPDGRRETSHGGTAWTFTAHQVLLSDSGYGIAVLSNSRPAYVEDTLGIVDGLIAMVGGDNPDGAMPYRLIADTLVGSLTLATIVVQVPMVLRASRWARRRLCKRTWTVPLRLLPHLVTVVVAAGFPKLMTSIGWDMNWHQLYFVAPSFAVWLTLLAAVGAAILVARIAWLIVHDRRTPAAAPVPGAANADAPPPSRAVGDGDMT